MFKLVIIGAGRGGSALLDVLSDDANIKVIAIADENPQAEALEQAALMSIPVVHDIEALPECDMAINVTGSIDVSKRLRKLYPKGVEIMEGKAARFFYDQISKKRQEKEQVEQMLSEFEKLNRIGRQLNTTFDLKGMLQMVLTEAMQMSASEAGTISLYDRDTRELSLHSAIGFSESFADQKPWIVRQGGLTEQIFDASKPFVVEDVDSRDDFKLNPMLAAEGVKALVAVPLSLGDEIVGILYVNDFSPRNYDDNQLAVLDLLASQAAHAIQKARLFERIQKEKDELKSLNEHLEARVLDRTEELTRSNQDLIRANQAKSQFLSNMSHELRTPLTSINGFSEFLLDGFVGPLNDAQTKYLKNINISGKHLLELINGILDLSKIESGKMTLKLERVDLQSLFDEVILVLEGYATKVSVTIELSCPEVPAILLDRTKFKQILYNLCSNAIKFSPEQGKVEIMVSYDEDSFLSGEKENYASLSVAIRDHGIGIDQKDHEKIFNPFEQADGSHSRNYEGTGLGLTLTRRLVEMHGGKIKLESTPGQGSCFTFQIPVDSGELLMSAETADESPRIALPVEAASNKPGVVNADAPLILVVDDDAHSLEISTLYLTQAGYRVCHAMNGEEALDVARKKRPFLILLDVMMPGKDGWEVLQELKLDVETSHIPVIMCTVSENEELSIALGATDYMSKPIDRDLLSNKLNTLSKGIQRRGKALHVLAIDDDDAIRELYTATLTAQGYRVHTASSGQEGIRMAESIEPDVIILDLMIPGMDGFEVAEKLKSLPRTQGIPIVVVTAKELSVAERMRLVGHIEECVSKQHFDSDDLIDEIRQFETLYPHQAGLKDSVSGLLNHRYFEIRLSQELTRAERNGHHLACVVFDLDRFARFCELVNEGYVHAALRKVGEFFMNHLRGSDIATRHRIDEFAMILTQTELEGALLVVNRLKNMIEAYPFPGEDELGEAGLTSCASIAIYPEDGDTAEALLQNCHSLLRSAKSDNNHNRLAYRQYGELVIK